MIAKIIFEIGFIVLGGYIVLHAANDLIQINTRKDIRNGKI